MTTIIIILAAAWWVASLIGTPYHDAFKVDR